MTRNSTNRITTRDGRILTYTVFHATLTNETYSAYSIVVSNSANAARLLPNAPSDASKILLLATCNRVGNRDERILVFAASYD